MDNGETIWLVDKYIYSLNRLRNDGDEDGNENDGEMNSKQSNSNSLIIRNYRT